MEEPVLDQRHWLLEGARVMASASDLRSTVEELAALLVPRVADGCRIHLEGDEETVRATEPEIRGDLATVPLRARGETIGTLSLEATTRRFDPGDRGFRELLELFASRAALALDNARLHTELRQARQRELETSRLETRLAQAQLEALRVQLNPHFLFNALNTIAMLVRRQAGADALKGIVALSQMLRQVLDRRATPEVRLGEELALVEHYLAVEQLRYRDRLRVTMNVAPGTLDALVPSLILQPLVENAVRHGIGRREGPGRVTLESRREGAALLIEVRDDGPGFPSGWQLAGAAGVGLGNTRERLARIYPDSHRLEAGNGTDGGARVRLEVPFRLGGDDSGRGSG